LVSKKKEYNLSMQNKLALVTGASSGIGREMARYLASQNIDLILVDCRQDRLIALQKELSVNCKIISCDLRQKENIFDLLDKVKKYNIDILINDAGFGDFGVFWETDLEKELEMMDVNCRASHILTKIFLKKMVEKDSGYILNVCSSAGFLAGPNMATYYATKNYLLKLTLAIHEELRKQRSNVYIGALCPGPTATEFNQVAGGEFALKEDDARFCARYAIDKMWHRKMIIIPRFRMKLLIFMQRFLSYRTQLRLTEKIQWPTKK
jgi:short-subunit dehydrogenase